MYKKMKKKVNELIKKIFPNPVYQICLTKYLQLSNRNNPNKYALPYFYKWKARSKEKYCIFRFHRPGSGLFAVANSYVFAYEWAVSKGYIPILDWEMDYSFMEYRVGEDNIWDCIFQQKLEVQHVLQKDWVLIRTIGMYDSWNSQTCLALNNQEEDCKLHMVTSNWREYYKKANKLASPCWTFRSTIWKEVNAYINGEMQGLNCLGVALQEDFSADADKIRTDENAKVVYANHPKTIGITETIHLVKEYMDKWKCDKIFLATIYQNSVEEFRKEFGDKVICLNRKRRELGASTKNIENLFNLSYKEMYDYYKNSDVKYEEECIPYAKEVILLARCQYLIAAPSSGTIAALTMNGGEYEDIHILYDYNHASNY